MPELPDLTIFAESLQKLVLKKEISEAVYHKNKPLNVDPDVFCASLKNQKITAIKRVGKQLLFELGDGGKFLVHLMLSGGFKLCQTGEEASFPVLTITFNDGKSLVLYDPKGMVSIAVNPDLGRPVADALDVTADYLEDIFRKKPKAILKAVLIDQKVMAGIGNAYADEILWHAKISPKSIVGKIPKNVITKLVSSIHSVLKDATEYLRKHHPGMISGEIRDFLSVHNPKLKASPSGSAIIVEQVASKKTYYTEEQTLYA
jgi:formamidopyrimidine-DNA glycosylase